MNIKKLKEAELKFLDKYPGGFSHPTLQEQAKKHKPEKMTLLTKESFKRENFKNINDILDNMAKIISRSSLVSVFEKPRFKEFAASLEGSDRIKLSAGLEKFLYEKNKKGRSDGFNLMMEVLEKGKLAKWSLISVCPFYFNPQTEVFMKPTTVKNVISYFELKDIEYKPRPSYDFYNRYQSQFIEMRNSVDKSLAVDNAYFSGFLMMAMENPSL